MRSTSVKSFFAVLTFVLAVTAAAPGTAFAQRENPRDQRLRARDETPIIRIVRVVRRILGITANETLSDPRPAPIKGE